MDEKTIDDWFSVYYSAPKGSELRQTALENMVTLAQTGEDWREIYLCAPKDSELEQIALKKMADKRGRVGGTFCTMPALPQ